MFKDDLQKLFIKKNNQWLYLDEEEEFDQLIESFNIKGIREKKLIE